MENLKRKNYEKRAETQWINQDNRHAILCDGESNEGIGMNV